MCGKETFISTHATIRARQRNIAWPDQVYNVLQTGIVKRHGKHEIKVIGKNIICVGVDTGNVVIIKTIERK